MAQPSIGCPPSILIRNEAYAGFRFRCYQTPNVQAFLEKKGVETVGALFLGNSLFHQPKPENVHVRAVALSKTAPSTDFRTMPLKGASLPIQLGPHRLIDTELLRDTAKPIPWDLSPMFREPALCLKELQQDRESKASRRSSVGQEFHFFGLKEPIVLMDVALHGVDFFALATAR